MKQYVVIHKNKVPFLNFDEVLETNSNTLRYSIDGNKTFIKFTGNIPTIIEDEEIFTIEGFEVYINDYTNGWCLSPENETI